MTGVAPQQHFGEVDKVVHGARDLERGDRADDGHDDPDDGPWDVFRGGVDARGDEHEDAGGAHEADADAAQARAKDDEDEDDENMEPDHEVPPLAEVPSIACRLPVRPRILTSRHPRHSYPR